MAPSSQPTTIVWAIRTRRVDMGLSQNALAKRAGIERGYISALERGSRRNLSSQKLEDIARALETTPHDLLRLAGSINEDRSSNDEVDITVKRENAGPLKRLDKYDTEVLLTIERLVHQIAKRMMDEQRMTSMTAARV